MKEKELRKHAYCSKCKKKVGHTGLPMFWTVETVRHGINPEAVLRQDSLAKMLGGNGTLAAAMGPDEDMSQELLRAQITLCENCAMEIASLLESCGVFDSHRTEERGKIGK